MHRAGTRAGFTLLELSLVLAIIALAIAGIFAGRDLIRSAELRKVISEYGEINQAITAFRTKYNCRPGDCLRALQFGLTDSGMNVSSGNGNGRLEITASGQGLQEQCGFWMHLKASHILNKNQTFDGTPNSCAKSEKFVPLKAIKASMIAAPEARDAGAPLNLQPTNITYIMLGAEYSASGCTNDVCPSLSASDAYYLDSKTDDGLPFTGATVAYGSFDDDWVVRDDARTYPEDAAAFYGAGGINAAVCVDNSSSPYEYNIANPTRNLCMSAVKSDW